MVSGYSILDERPGNDEIWRDAVGIVIASFYYYLIT